jgi:tRNA (adenine-N(1)-)-methyltransferase non-catalytic subunit
MDSLTTSIRYFESTSNSAKYVSVKLDLVSSCSLPPSCSTTYAWADRVCRIVSLGKYGTFSSNLIIAHPYNHTYELLDRLPGQKDSDLRMVPASELHADVIAEEHASQNNGNSGEGNVVLGGDGVEFQLVGENGEVIMRSNRETIDDSARQTLTMEEIEELKREGAGAGKDLIAKLMLSHSGIREKTSFSLAKYKVLKEKKFLRRFTVLPMDVGTMTYWMMEEKDASKILEIRQEMLALVGSWVNIHWAEEPACTPGIGGGRWLVVDETGGLLVAAMAERMGILYPEDDHEEEAIPGDETEEPTHHYREDLPLATSNTLTHIHNNTQPNLSLLKYFHYEPNTTSSPKTPHPLASHLHPLSWLQLLSPHLDSTYSTPPQTYSSDELASFKSGKRGTYYRKLRRYNRTKQIVDGTLGGGFDGLAIASSMSPESILKHTIRLLRGGAQIAVYSPTIEPLTNLSDLYSTSRRTAFIQSPPSEIEGLSNEEIAKWGGNEDFPLNPTLVLNSNVQSARVREWQVLPGRTHPIMTGRGGAEGYLWSGTRVVPAVGRVEARGKFGRKRKVEAGGGDEGEKKVKVEESVSDIAREKETDVEMAQS